MVASESDKALQWPTTSPLARLVVKGTDKVTIIGPQSLLTSSNDDDKRPNVLRVGRQAATADLRIQHSSISRQHALLYYVEHKATCTICVHDLGGKHGTTVNGVRIESQQPHPLHIGDSILFGKVTDETYVVELHNDENIENEQTAGDLDTATKPKPSDKETTEAPRSSRAQREAELAAVMASLDEKPTYIAADQIPEETSVDNSNHATVHSRADLKKLPITKTFPLSSTGSGRNSVTFGHGGRRRPRGCTICVGGDSKVSGSRVPTVSAATATNASATGIKIKVQT